MKTISVKLPEALAAWLSRRASELGRPQSDLVREALQRSKEGSAAITMGRSLRVALGELINYVLNRATDRLGGLGEADEGERS